MVLKSFENRSETYITRPRSDKFFPILPYLPLRYPCFRISVKREYEAGHSIVLSVTSRSRLIFRSPVDFSISPSDDLIILL